jgi:hypothetical protein
MKTIFAVLAAGIFFADTACAIPQTFNPNGFQGAVGMPFEQYVATVAVWAPGATLKGPWKPRDRKAAKADGLETLDLGVDATVFGIAAAQVSAERVAGVVRRFMVRFDESKQKNGKARAGGLYDQVMTNLTALAGEAKSVSPSGEKIFRYESALITARKSGGKEVIVEFTPAR